MILRFLRWTFWQKSLISWIQKIHQSWDRFHLKEQTSVIKTKSNFAKSNGGFLRKMHLKVVLCWKLRGYSIFCPLPPPGKPKILSKLFILGPPNSLQIKLYQKFYPPFPRDAPEGYRPILTINLSLFSAVNGGKKWSPYWSEMD